MSVKQGQSTGSSGASSVTVTGNVTVVQPTGTNLHAVVDSGAITTVSAVTAITNALPAGTNVIGHVINDTGSTTVVTGNVTVVQPTGTSLHAVLDANSGVDIGKLTANQTVDVAKLGGVAISLNTGVRDAGTQRVTIATDDSVPVTISGLTNTQYTEDVAAATDPVGTSLNLVRDDYRKGNLTSQDGDNVAARGTNSGELYVKHVDPITVGGDVLIRGALGPVVQIEGSLEQATYDVNMARVLGTQPIVDGSGRLSAVVSGTLAQVQQRATTFEQTTYDTGLNPIVAILLAAVQSLITTQRPQGPSDARIRVQQEMSDISARLAEQQALTALQSEWDGLLNQDYQMNILQSVNGGATGYSLAQGQSGMSCYLMQEVR